MKCKEPTVNLEECESKTITRNGKTIEYIEKKVDNPNAPWVVWVHGSGFTNGCGEKASHMASHCKEKGYNFVTFNNFGAKECRSSGKYLEQTISTWLEGLNMVVQDVAGPNIVLVASSMGGWIGLRSILDNPDKIKAFVGLAAAPDYTEDIYNQMTPEERDELKKKNYFCFLTPDAKKEFAAALQEGKDPKKKHYGEEITQDLVDDAKQHLLVTKGQGQDITKITQPIILFHGTDDDEVDFKDSIKIQSMVGSEYCDVQIIKNEGHRMKGVFTIPKWIRAVDDLMELSGAIRTETDQHEEQPIMLAGGDNALGDVAHA